MVRTTQLQHEDELETQEESGKVTVRGKVEARVVRSEVRKMTRNTDLRDREKVETETVAEQELDTVKTFEVKATGDSKEQAIQRHKDKIAAMMSGQRPFTRNLDAGFTRYFWAEGGA